MKQYIAYKGSEFSIEWYFDARGQALALEHFKKQPTNKQRKVLNLFRLMGDQGKIFDETKFRNEEDKIYAFKPQPDRYFCFFFRGKKIIVTNAFTKKSQKMPKGEKELAVKAKQSYEKRIKEGTYYEKES
jgi:phage-related protein